MCLYMIVHCACYTILHVYTMYMSVFTYLCMHNKVKQGIYTHTHTCYVMFSHSMYVYIL